LAYRKLDPAIVEEVLRRWQRRESARLIARAVGVDRKTVGRFVASATTLALPCDRDLTEGEVERVIWRARVRRAAKPLSEEWLAVLAERERIAGWLTEPRPLSLQTIHLLLRRDHGLWVSYATLRRFAIRELGWRRPPSASPRAPKVRPAAESGTRLVAAVAVSSRPPAIADLDLMTRFAAR
jgi:hypothetical protein